MAVAGGRTMWEVGGSLDAGARVVDAPAGVVEHRPAEMIVRVLAGTTVEALDAALAPSGQMVPLDPVEPERATVGGVLSVGRSGLRRLRYGPVRDFVLEARYVSAAGELVRAGAPVVKNVSGFDLVRVLVGSLGTLGCLGELVLRTVPRPEASEWWRGPGEAAAGVLSALYRPGSVLWDNDSTWVLLEGHPDDVTHQSAGLGPAWERSGPPTPPGVGRMSVPPAEVLPVGCRLPPGSFVAEVGVGVLHVGEAAATLITGSRPDPGADGIGQRLKAGFDPAGRLNPGRRP